MTQTKEGVIGNVEICLRNPFPELREIFPVINNMILNGNNFKISIEYQEKAKLPFTPGLEVSGEVIECCGCNHVRVGDHVFCIFSGEGGYSEECVTEENRCFLVPEVFAC